uniref:guanine nucleotide-binding protein subunit beta-like protein 1 isoform X2 n=1 Tax=Nyctereutes procyonoides TaxID=34880 RepID=UPI002444058A|nr:guanine nucleotide-binding protein subunit beta-like protein 1 isoform X2 [Nyctereutes procyonoides]
MPSRACPCAWSCGSSRQVTGLTKGWPQVSACRREAGRRSSTRPGEQGHGSGRQGAALGNLGLCALQPPSSEPPNSGPCQPGSTGVYNPGGGGHTEPPNCYRPWRTRGLAPQPGHSTGPLSGAPSPRKRTRNLWELTAALSLQADSGPRPLLLAGYEDGSVALWDVSERKVCSRVACHTEPVMGFDFDSQKARGVSGSAEKALAVWSLDEQQALQVCRTHELTNPGIADVKIRPDRKILATAGWDHRVRVFHWRTMKPLAVLSFHSATVHCVAFATDGLLAAGSGDQRISIWSLYPISTDSSAPLLGHTEGGEVGAHASA